jgi:hypothetical protein
MTKSYKLFEKAKSMCKDIKHLKITDAFEETVKNNDELSNHEKQEIITSVLCSPFKVDSINRNYK